MNILGKDFFLLLIFYQSRIELSFKRFYKNFTLKMSQDLRSNKHFQKYMFINTLNRCDSKLLPWKKTLKLKFSLETFYLSGMGKTNRSDLNIVL